MSLAPGTRFGPYEILAPLGAGGMGEVYRAKDTRLGRDVAVKILPDGVATDPDRLRRFEQEARTVGQLSHPALLTLFDVGAEGGRSYLVTELLEGRTLRDLLVGGPLPARRAIDLACQVARGLAAAHEKGIVHRDLKPENLFVTADGRIKILDFGLAKLQRPEDSGSQIATLGSETAAGMVLGSVGYMAPEQVRGDKVDARADLFALGTVLYEMLAGSRAFLRPSAAESMTAILREEPPDLPAALGALDRIVRRCLEKSREARFQNASDLAFALESLSNPSGERTGTIATVAARPSRRVATLIATALLSLLLGLLVGRLLPRAGATLPGPLQLSLALPGEDDPNQSWRVMPVPSPDGRQFAWLQRDPTSGIVEMVVRSVESREVRSLNVASSRLEWSTDGQQLLGISEGEIFRYELSSGTRQRLAAAPNFAGMSWGAADRIAFVPYWGAPIHVVSAAGGEAKPVTKLAAERREVLHLHPSFLPDGRRFLYMVRTREAGGARIRAGSIDGELDAEVAPAEAGVRFVAPDLVLFMRNGVLLAQRLELDTLRLLGEPVAVADEIEWNASDLMMFMTASPRLLSLARPSASKVELLRVHPGGDVTTIGQPFELAGLTAASPDGHLAALQVKDPKLGAENLGVVDLETGALRRLTRNSYWARGAQWSADGQSILYASDPEGPLAIYRLRVDGASSPEKLLGAAGDLDLLAVLPDGSGFLYTDPGARGVWKKTFAPDQAPTRLVDDDSFIENGQVSPDGRWLIFVRQRETTREFVLLPLEQPDRRRLVDAGNATHLIGWQADGRAIAFGGSGDPVLVGVDFASGSPRLSPAKPLFSRDTLDRLGDRARFAGMASLPDGGYVALRRTSASRWESILLVDWVPKALR